MDFPTLSSFYPRRGRNRTEHANAKLSNSENNFDLDNFAKTTSHGMKTKTHTEKDMNTNFDQTVRSNLYQKNSTYSRKSTYIKKPTFVKKTTFENKADKVSFADSMQPPKESTSYQLIKLELRSQYSIEEEKFSSPLKKKDTSKTLTDRQVRITAHGIKAMNKTTDGWEKPDSGNISIMQRLDEKTRRLLGKLVNNNCFMPNVRESLTNFDRLYRPNKWAKRTSMQLQEDKFSWSGKKTPRDRGAAGDF
jgi:hypothetical protein